MIRFCCPLEDCDWKIIEALDIGDHVLFTCKGLHEVLIPKPYVKKQRELRCGFGAKGGDIICLECKCKWCKFSSEYKDLEPEEGKCPVCGTKWDTRSIYCKNCVIESRKEYAGRRSGII